VAFTGLPVSALDAVAEQSPTFVKHLPKKPRDVELAPRHTTRGTDLHKSEMPVEPLGGKLASTSNTITWNGFKLLWCADGLVHIVFP
jgi:hypothetical protein